MRRKQECTFIRSFLWNLNGELLSMFIHCIWRHGENRVGNLTQVRVISQIWLSEKWRERCQEWGWVQGGYATTTVTMTLSYSENRPVSENSSSSNIPPPAPCLKQLSSLARGLIASSLTSVPLPGSHLSLGLSVVCSFIHSIPLKIEDRGGKIFISLFQIYRLPGFITLYIHASTADFWWNSNGFVLPFLPITPTNLASRMNLILLPLNPTRKTCSLSNRKWNFQFYEQIQIHVVW